MACLAIHNFEDQVCHHIPLKIGEVEMIIIPVWHRVFHLYVEPNMRREGAKHLKDNKPGGRWGEGGSGEYYASVSAIPVPPVPV